MIAWLRNFLRAINRRVAGIVHDMSIAIHNRFTEQQTRRKK
jgi:hypothetical protein